MKLRIESWFWSFNKGMNGITNVHIVARHTKMCESVIPFIPSLNDQNQLSILIINFCIHVQILNKTNIICCNWCNFSIFQPSNRARICNSKERNFHLCYRPIVVLIDIKRLIYTERLAAENKYLERENKQIMLSLIVFMTGRFYIVIFFTKQFHGSAEFAFQTRSQSVFTE